MGAHKHISHMGRNDVQDEFIDCSRLGCGKAEEERIIYIGVNSFAKCLTKLCTITWFASLCFPVS